MKKMLCLIPLIFMIIGCNKESDEEKMDLTNKLKTDFTHSFNKELSSTKKDVSNLTATVDYHDMLLSKKETEKEKPVLTTPKKKVVKKGKKPINMDEILGGEPQADVEKLGELGEKSEISQPVIKLKKGKLRHKIAATNKKGKLIEPTNDDFEPSWEKEVSSISNRLRKVESTVEGIGSQVGTLIDTVTDLRVEKNNRHIDSSLKQEIEGIKEDVGNLKLDLNAVNEANKNDVADLQVNLNQVREDVEFKKEETSIKKEDKEQETSVEEEAEE